MTLGGIDKEGVYHNQCIIDKMIEQKDESQLSKLAIFTFRTKNSNK